MHWTRRAPEFGHLELCFCLNHGITRSFVLRLSRVFPLGPGCISLSKSPDSPQAFLASTFSITIQRLVRDMGRHSWMRTMSPTFAELLGA